MLTRRSLILSSVAAGGILMPRRLGAGLRLVGHDASVCAENRISYLGFMHCELHPYYTEVRSLWGCTCSVGECRPTKFQYVPESEANPEGVEVMVGGIFFPVPTGKLHHERKIPKELLAWPAHVCCTVEPPAPTITCAWINKPDS